MPPLILIIHNVRSVYNVGALFRSVDGVKGEKIILSGFSPEPKDRFGREREDFHKTALGAEKEVLWSSTKDILKTIEDLKKMGFFIAALEQHPSSLSYTHLPRNKKVALICGDEVRGIEKEVCEKCDGIFEIPMYGKKESLNVSVAGGIALYFLRSSF
jgi:23S rRNA (guanosine2251-2'-O)-methyltransferase